MRARFAASWVLASLSFACTVPQGPLGAGMPVADAGTPVSAPVTMSASDRCFGDSAPEAIAQEPRPRDLFANGRDVLWRSGASIRRMDVATGRASTLDASKLQFIKVADSSGVFGADGVMNLLALDLPSGHTRVVSASSTWPTGSATRPLPAVIALFDAAYALDSEYVYVAWHPDPAIYNFVSQGANARNIKGPHDFGDLARVKRDGASAPEFLGKGPDARFIVSDGYAYWGSRWEGLKRRALTAGAPDEVLWPAPDVPFIWAIAVSAGRVYFSVIASLGPPRAYSIESVPAAPVATDGGAVQPTVHVASAGLPFGDGVLDGKCVYTGGPGGVTRANLADGTVQQIIGGQPVQGDATVYGSQLLATDGRYLYWADNGGGRIVRWHR